MNFARNLNYRIYFLICHSHYLFTNQIGSYIWDFISFWYYSSARFKHFYLLPITNKYVRALRVIVEHHVAVEQHRGKQRNLHWHEVSFYKWSIFPYHFPFQINFLKCFNSFEKVVHCAKGSAVLLDIWLWIDAKCRSCPWDSFEKAFSRLTFAW